MRWRWTRSRGILSPFNGNIFHHRHRGLRLGVAVSRRHATVDRQAIAILHQHMPRVGQLGLLARTLAGQPRLGVGGRLVGLVAAALTVEINRGIARVIGGRFAAVILCV